MSEILTRLKLPNSLACGIMEWGRKSVDEMITMARQRGEQLKAEGEAILNAPNDAFQIDIVRGNKVQLHIKELQKATAAGSSAPVVRTDPVMEAIARKLHGIDAVPPAEGVRMIRRAVRAGAQALKEQIKPSVEQPATFEEQSTTEAGNTK